MNTNLARTRFAPSPTGPLHIGGLRTALFNYLFARNYEGTFIVRIEDTDQNRFVAGAEEYILESLKWCGIVPDEGVMEGGPYGPYRQSERKDIYQKYAKKLISLGEAYYAFDSPEELEQLRKTYESRKESFIYNNKVRGGLNNSIALSEPEVERLLEEGHPYVIRYKFSEEEEIIIHDQIRGLVTFNTSTLDDKVLFKSDGMPTYHLANVVDDYLMKITNVIRGEEWLPSLPLHFCLYRSFGWEDDMPQFAHLPLILKPDGNGKLSKRDGAKGGFPVFPIQWKDPGTGQESPGFREVGYFPEACVNILALLGWNPGTQEEIFSMKELIRVFELGKVNKSGAKFDPDKARWVNHQYLQSKSSAELIPSFLSILAEKGITASSDFVMKVIDLVKERADFVKDIWTHADFFFRPPADYDEQVVKKRWKEDTAVHIYQLAQVLESCDVFDAVEIETKVKGFILENNLNTGNIMNAWRLCLVGTLKGPGMFDIAALLGKEETVGRIKTTLEKLASN